MKLLQYPPKRFDIFIFISDVGIFKINPITHFLGQVVPDIRVFHHLSAAGGIVIVNTYGFANIIFRNSQLFLNSQLNRQTMGIPATFAFYTITFQGFITTKNILDGTGHHMMYSRHSIR